MTTNEENKKRKQRTEAKVKPANARFAQGQIPVSIVVVFVTQTVINFTLTPRIALK